MTAGNGGSRPETVAASQGTVTRKIRFDDPEAVRALAGHLTEGLRRIEEGLGTAIDYRGTEFVLTGGTEVDLDFAETFLRQIYRLAVTGYPLSRRDLLHAMAMLRSDPAADLCQVFGTNIVLKRNRRVVAPKSLNQRDYIEAMRRHDMVFAVGPAGTGKTYLAMAFAIAALMRREVKRIVLARPAVEAGERLGFLPGDLAEKVNPYLRPLYDALHDMVEFDDARRMLESGVIEVAPLAFMRGRTLNGSFVVLDEAQNTTVEQMKMFLTRLGHDSKAVVTGDVTQIDLPREIESGLVSAVRVLEGVEGIAIRRLTPADVVRHDLVQRIIRAYERAEKGS